MGLAIEERLGQLQIQWGQIEIDRQVAGSGSAGKMSVDEKLRGWREDLIENQKFPGR